MITRKKTKVLVVDNGQRRVVSETLYNHNPCGSVLERETREYKIAETLQEALTLAGSEAKLLELFNDAFNLQKEGEHIDSLKESSLNV